MATFQGKSILVIEDEALIALSLTLACAEKGMKVVGPISAFAEAVTLCQSGKFDAAIVDLQLDSPDLFAPCEILPSRSVPFVVYTGCAALDRVKQRFPSAEVCPKPAAPGTVIGLLAAALEAKRR
jgi:DNA-binding response OmpR family regulator